MIKARGGGRRTPANFLPPPDVATAARTGKVAARRLRKGHARPRRAMGRRALQDVQVYALKVTDRGEQLTVRGLAMRFGWTEGIACEMIAALLEDKVLEEVEPGRYVCKQQRLTQLDPDAEGPTDGE